MGKFASLIEIPRRAFKKQNILGNVNNTFALC